MELIALLKNNVPLFLTIVGLFSLLVGNFLNAVIYRLPIMFQQDWREECQESLGGEDSETSVESSKQFNLFVPRSQCPTCGHHITAIENIPVISYLFLRGKCSSCKTNISIRYPFIEIFTALISVFIASKMGFGWQALAALVFTWTLITLFFLDEKIIQLRDYITVPLMWLGIVVNYQSLFIDLESSVLGAMIGYISLWSLCHLFHLLTGKEVMNNGDFKILAAIGAWGGWQILSFTIFASSLVGAIVGISLIVIQHKKENQSILFGSWLVLTGFIGFIWRDEIIQVMNFVIISLNINVT